MHLILLFVFGFLSLTLRAATPADPAALAAAIDAALVARDVSALSALVDTEGMTADDLGKIAPGLAGLIPDERRATVTTDRLPEGINLAAPMIYNGKRIELTRAPTGVIRVTLKTGRTELVSTLPYVQTPAGCFLVGRKQTDLGWQGPPDRQLGFTFAEDYPRMPTRLTIRYNASGVDLEDSFSSHSGALRGQHIGELTVTGLQEGFKGRLVLTEAGKEIFRSEPIIGQTSFTYRRSAP
jgi:hypothetical protein